MDFQARFEKNKAIDAVFTKNMQFFKAGWTEVYDEFLNYKPVKLTLAFDDNEDVNIVNIQTGRFVYPEEPHIYAEKQVELFMNNQIANVVRFVNSHIVDTKYIHHAMIDKLIELRGDSMMPHFLPKDEEVIQQLFVIGIGSGLHLKEVVEKSNINQLVIVDDNKDTFYLSMHFVDWEEIFTSVKGNVKLVIGDSEADILDNLHEYCYEVGYFALAKTFVLRHYANETLDRLISNFFKKLIAPSSAAGFYDDERVGLAHTVENCARSIPPSTVGLLQRKVECQFPAVVIGNGPSLDKCEAFLRDNQDKLILISCGSSLSTLQNMGLKPDIHVEQERPYDTYRWLTKSTTAEFREGIYFYGLNTVHPDCFGLFDEDKVGQCLKPNDLGTIYLARSIKKGGTLSFANFSNPTVTNFGLSLCTLIGMRNVFLAGVDLGMKDVEKHHSEKSYYKQLKIDTPDILKSIETTEDKFLVPGRNGQRVYTTPALNSTRLFIEKLIEKHELSVFNLGDGAEIKGAPFTDFDIPIADMAGKSKAKTLAALHKVVFPGGVIDPQSKEQVLLSMQKETKSFFMHLKKIMSKKLNTEEELVSALSEIRSEFHEANLNSYTHMLLKGTVETLLAAIYSVVVYANKDKYQEVYSKCCEIIDPFLDEIEHDIEKNFYNLDTYTNL